jgi:small conductance mechanosensitive channel
VLREEDVNNINAVRRYLNELPDQALQLGGRAIVALLLFLIGTQIIRLFRKVIRRTLRKANADVGLVQFLDSFLKVVLYIVLFAMLARGFGFDATSVAAVIGTVGVAIGLAVQGSLSNLAGGVLIILLKPFKVGDYIKEDVRGNEGTVTEIDLIYTKLTTADNKTVILPNGTLANASLTNVTAHPERRLDIRLTLAPDADVTVAKKKLTKLLEMDEAVLKDREYEVGVDEFVYGGIVLVVRCWLKTEDYAAAKWRLNEGIANTLNKAGVGLQCACPNKT